MEDLYTKNKKTLLDQIMFFFSDKKILFNYKIDSYTTDLFFPEYNLAIDCFQVFNGGYDNQKERCFLSKKISLIKINPLDEYFSILNIIKRIHFFIINKYTT